MRNKPEINHQKYVGPITLVEWLSDYAPRWLKLCNEARVLFVKLIPLRHLFPTQEDSLLFIQSDVAESFQLLKCTFGEVWKTESESLSGSERR